MDRWCNSRVLLFSTIAFVNFLDNFFLFFFFVVIVCNVTSHHEGKICTFFCLLGMFWCFRENFLFFSHTHESLFPFWLQSTFCYVDVQLYSYKFIVCYFTLFYFMYINLFRQGFFTMNYHQYLIFLTREGRLLWFILQLTLICDWISFCTDFWIRKLSYML